jgi:hypothetical protein
MKAKVKALNGDEGMHQYYSSLHRENHENKELCTLIKSKAKLTLFICNGRTKTCLALMMEVRYISELHLIQVISAAHLVVVKEEEALSTKICVSLQRMSN